MYFGVININEGHRNIGSVDVWRSVVTKELFCEEKRIGVLDISDKIGLNRIDKSKKWAVAINRKRSGTNRWKLIELAVNGLSDSLIQMMSQWLKSIVKTLVLLMPTGGVLVEPNVNRTLDVTEVLPGNATK